MKFRLINLRGHLYDSETLKDLIIKTTKSKYEEKKVKPEFTGKRPSVLKNELDCNEYKTFTNVFLITALKRINSDVRTRYLIISENNYADLYKILNPQIPVYYIEQPNSGKEVSTLSSWFRNTMGNGFSFIDFDFIIQKDNKVIIIEEKSNSSCEMGYGQALSYMELYNDVLSKTLDKKILFVFNKQHKELVVREYNANSNNYELLKDITDIITFNNYIKKYLIGE